MSTTHINRIERGTRRVSLTALMKIAKALETTRGRLLCDDSTHDQEECQEDFKQLIQGCTNIEKTIIYEIIVTIINSLRNNRWPNPKT